MRNLDTMERYRDLASREPKDSLKGQISEALAGWWRGTSAGGQTIGREGEVLPVVSILTKILGKIESGELVEKES